MNVKIILKNNRFVIVTNDNRQVYDSLDNKPCIYYTRATAEYMMNRLTAQNRLFALHEDDEKWLLK